MATLEALLADLRARDIGLRLDEGGNLRVSAPREALTPSLRSQLEARKAEIVAYLASASGDGELPPLAPAPRRGRLPLSFIQERLWFLHQLDPHGSAHNIAIAVTTAGAVDLDVLQRSLAELLRRHEVLRCVFPSVDGEPVCVVTPPGDVALRVADLTGFEPAERAAERARLRHAEVRAPIDLERGPVIRFMLVRGPERSELLVTQHHMVTDRWSLGVLLKELPRIYEAYRAGEPSPLPDPRLQYVDFAAWQRDWLRGPALERELAFWKGRLAGAPPALDVASDRPRPTLLTYAAATETLVLPKSLADEVARLSRAERCSPFMTLLAAWKVLLARHSDQTDIVVGSPVAGRPIVELEGMLGCFINTVVFRSSLAENPTFLELLRTVRPMVLDALSHQHLPFEKLVQEIQVERDPGRSPLAQVGFVYQNFSASVEVPAGVEILSSGGSVFDLTLYLVDTADGLSATLEFSEALFDRTTAVRMLHRYRTLLEGIAAEPEQRIGDLPLLSPDERRGLQAEWERTRRPYAADATVVELVARAAERRGEAVALVSGDQSLSYAELDARSTRVALHLRALGARHGTTVAVALERSADLVVALLGVLKSGAAYLPLDPAHPQARLDYTLRDAGAAILITHEPGRWQGHEARLLTPEEATAPLDAHAAGTLPRPEPEATAYVIYTSGSTGKPKGVEAPHRALANFLNSMRREPGLEEKDVLLAVTTPSFDISILELFLPLVVGATVVVATRGEAGDGRKLIALLDRHDVTVMQATPSTWRMLLDERWGGRRGLEILVGGEALPRDLADALLERAASVWNMYGPTETTIWSTLQRVEPSTEPVAIGRPIDNTHLLILDRNGQLAPVGVPGEICIGGDGVATGYRGRPELTAERFVEDTFTGRPGGRLYRTGDLGRLRPDGRFEYLGRMDNQVKVRGFRIELGEVESVLRSHPDVRDAAVAVRDAKLAAFVIYEPGADLTVTEMRRWASRELPDYMVPSMVVEVSVIPMTLNGKVDRKALPNPFQRGPVARDAQEPPATEAERLVAGVWSELLGVGGIGAHDNFYEVGGHSLLSIRAVHAIEQRTGHRIDPRTMFFQSLRQIAEALP
jgi:amino acid adenylation domain-containing protein